MNKPKVGLVGVCSHYEFGAERYEKLVVDAAEAMSAAGMEVVTAEKAVFNTLDAVSVCSQFKAAGIESLTIIDITWVCDSLKYIFVNELDLPIVFWAVPYTETFSIGCIQNFASALKLEKIHFEYVYGLADDAGLIEKIRKVAVTGQVVKKVHSLRIALAGPRQTWRVAGPQDMTVEEWEFSRTFGPTLVHLEVEDITREAEKISDAEAEKTLDSLKSRTGKVLASRKTMLWMAKVYMASRELMEKKGIDVIAAECYPQYCGLMNQPSSWIEDDGFVLDTEGDIGNALIKYIFHMIAPESCSALGEIGSYSDADNCLQIAHEGSSPASMAESLDQVQVSPSGENGCFVGLPLKPMEHCTVCDFQGTAGKYQMLVANGSVLSATHDEWVSGGQKLLIKLRFDDVKPGKAIEEMIGAGLHHHLVVKEGDLAEQMKMICEYLGIQVVSLK